VPADWQPTCSLELLRLRAQTLAKVREFFAQRAVLEVETPLLSHSIGTDPNLAFFSTDYISAPVTQTMYLQTSPEFAMKRLLASGSGSIFQISKAFRNSESGRFHNPEFTLLEWYRVDFDLNQLMTDITDLISYLFGAKLDLHAMQRISYQQIFYQHTGLDALVFSAQAYNEFALQIGLPEALSLCGHDHALWLDLLFSHCVQARMEHLSCYLVYGYPACQSSLARLNPADARITERVELFINGVECGNGYHELCDPQEQDRRFCNELTVREQKQLPVPTKDQHLLAALVSGLPDCSGMAIGIDRLLMLLSNSKSINDVLAFPVCRA